MKGKMFGVSVGPGDWKMMTLRAKEALLDSDIICFPAKAKDSSSFALSIIQQAKVSLRTQMVYIMGLCHMEIL